MTPLFDKLINECLQLVNESVSFFVADAERAVDSLGDISWKLNSKFHDFMLKNAGFTLDNYPDILRGEKIVVDGSSDYFGREGVLSMYLAGVPNELIDKTIAMIKYYIGEYQGELTGPIKREQSNWQKSEVVRFPIRVAEATDNPPELNLSNANARAIISDVLNYPSDTDINGDSLNAKELLMKIEQIEDNDYIINKAERKYEQDGNHISYGLSPERIKQILDEIKKICEWAIERDYTSIGLS